MKVSAISQGDDRSSMKNSFIRYSNSFMSMSEPEDAKEKSFLSIPSKKDKLMGLETLTIFPKQVIDGKTVITA